MRHGKAKLAALAIGLAVAVPLAAQTTAPSGPAGTTATTGTAMQQEDDGFDWGWLGLIGLAGLAGLRGRDAGRTHTNRL